MRFSGRKQRRLGPSTGVVLTTLALAVTGCSTDSTDSARPPASAGSSATSAIPTVDPGPEPTSTPLTPASGVPAAEAAAGKAAVRRYTAAALAVLAGPRTAQTTEAALRRAAGGRALADLLTQRTEYAGRGLRVSGRVRVVQQVVVRRRADPPRLVVAACVDTSRVTVRDRTGDTVPTSSEARTRNLLTLDRRSGRWLVVAADLPSDPTC